MVRPVSAGVDKQAASGYWVFEILVVAVRLPLPAPPPAPKGATPLAVRRNHEARLAGSRAHAKPGLARGRGERAREPARSRGGAGARGRAGTRGIARHTGATHARGQRAENRRSKPAPFPAGSEGYGTGPEGARSWGPSGAFPGRSGRTRAHTAQGAQAHDARTRGREQAGRRARATHGRRRRLGSAHAQATRTCGRERALGSGRAGAGALGSCAPLPPAGLAVR